MGKLLLLFTVVPLVELYLLLYLGRVLGFWSTVAIVFVTGVAGATLAKRQGARVLANWRESLASGTMPEEGVLGGVLVLVGGVLLVTPGVFTDLVGLSLLVPVTRALWARAVRAWLERRIQQGDVTVMTMGSMSGFGVDPRAAGPRRPRERGSSGYTGRPGRNPGPGPSVVIDVEGYEVPSDRDGSGEPRLHTTDDDQPS